MHHHAARGRNREAGPGGGSAIAGSTVTRRDEGCVGGNRVCDRHARRCCVADVAERDRVVDVARGADRDSCVDLGDHEGRRLCRIGKAPRATAVRSGCDHAVIAVEVDLVHGHGRDARAERAPVSAAVVGDERTDVGRRVEGVGKRGVERQRVDRVVRQVAADVRPRATCVGRLEDVTRLVWRRRVVAVVADVSDPVVASVDRDPSHGPVRQRVLVATAVAVLVDASPRRVVAGHGVRAEVDEPVVRARVDPGSATDPDCRDDTGARAVGRWAGAAAGEVRADRVEVHVARARRLCVVGAVETVRRGEQLVGVQLVQGDRDVELRAVVAVDAVGQPRVGPCTSAVREAVQRNAEVRAVDVASGTKGAAAGLGGLVDHHLAAVTRRCVKPALGVDGLAQRAVVLGASPEPLCGKANGHEHLRHRRYGSELADLQAGPVKDPAAGRDRSVEVLPGHCAQRIGGIGTAAAAVAVPDATIIAQEHVVGVGGVERQGVEVGVHVVTKVFPRHAAVVGPEDPAGRGRHAVAERARDEEDVRICRVGLHDVVVETLRAAVVEHSVKRLGARRQLGPRRALVDRLEDASRMMVLRRVDPVEAGVQGRFRITRGVRESEREAGETCREVGVRRQAVHDRVPRHSAVGALVDPVAPEGGVQSGRMLRVEPDVGRAQ